MSNSRSLTRTALRFAGLGTLVATTMLMQTGAADAANTCTWTESTYSVTFHCNLDGHTSYAVCFGSAQFAAYRGTPQTKTTGSFGGSKTISDGTLYLVRGSESCTASG